jgi:hypothetical protein
MIFKHDRHKTVDSSTHKAIIYSFFNLNFIFDMSYLNNTRGSKALSSNPSPSKQKIIIQGDSIVIIPHVCTVYLEPVHPLRYIPLTLFSAPHYSCFQIIIIWCHWWWSLIKGHQNITLFLISVCFILVVFCYSLWKYCIIKLLFFDKVIGS